MTDEQRARVSAGRMGYVMSAEQRAKISAAEKGRIFSPETRAKISAKASNRTPETRAKISAVHMGMTPFLGRHHSEAAKAKQAAAKIGKILLPETRAKIAATLWKGGLYASSRRTSARRRAFGFVPLNEPFDGCHGHHVDNELVIYMPKDLHRSIYHRQTDGMGMEQINALAYEWLAQESA